MRSGALDAYERVERSADLLVLVCRTAWFLDDPSSWLVVHGADRPRLHRLKDRTVRALVPTSNACLAATAEGDVLRIDADGKLSSLIAPASLTAALRTADRGLRLYLRGITLVHGGLVIVAGLAVDSAGGLTWHSTYVVFVESERNKATVLHATRPIDGEPEILDCAAINV
jgi:hypothetical protein